MRAAGRALSGLRKLFRFTYLAESKTSQGRDALRMLLRQNGYRVAPVTIDTSDWYIDARLVARLRREKGEPIATYRRFSLVHLMDRAHYYDGLARAIFGHSIDHVILLHHRLTTSLFLEDALGMFRREGWRLVDAKTALAQPELSLQPDTIPLGQSLLWALEKQQGTGGALRYPGEDGDYESGKMDSLAL